ncbi:MAG: MotA/TolQ/ExbB proton channel family protein [Nitrospinae bacterium]|nr:MotA/TolQ/ExbB proton channel family protein [Nitrospinota bacterium]MBI3814104.1 MotA/TolQ/ExbB proton channel family protein [Nitrospinota bacterium]
MEFGRIIGLISGIGAMLIAIALEKGQYIAYVNLSAFIIIAGGSFGAILLSVGFSEIKRIPPLLKIAVSKDTVPDYDRTLKILIELATIVRKQGYLALETKLQSINDPFLKRGIGLIIDGFNESSIIESLEYEILSLSRRHKNGIEIFNLLGGYAPTMGIIGTVLGLVNMLLHMGQLGSEGLGHAVAVAFIATLYGIAFANLIFLPIGANLKGKSEREIAYRRVILKSILILQTGENPRILEDKIRSMMGVKS